MCTESPGELSLNFTYFDSVTNEEKTIPITAKILDTPYELILGRPDIKKHNILQRIGNHLYVESNSSEPLRAGQTSLKEHTQFRDSNGGPEGSSMLSMLYKKEDLLSPEYDDDGLEGNDHPLPWDTEEIAAQHHNHAAIPSDEAYTLPEVAGSEQFQAKIRKLLKEYKHVFSEELRKEPAKLEPFDVKFDRNKWQRPKNGLPPRPQSRNKHAEIKRQIDKMLAAGVITPSQAPWYSQVHLTPKPNDKWRFCIDFRALNECSESMGWPIPNVYRMLQRLGNKRAKYYGVMDLTSGYYQAPLSKASQAASAFTTDFGTFEWLRVPMGLKGAPSYFQQQMAQTVLCGLLYQILEIYLDDIITFGNTEDEYIDNLRQVFDRLVKFGITLNPNKCRFGLEEVEYVGHTINSQGMSFSEVKRGEVLDFPLPTTHKELKSFLGLANYFRDHVKNHSMITQPLQGMVTNYTKNKPLKWTDELIATFHKVRKTVGECPKLHFIDDKLPLFLHTDASDYGIGAYLFQKTAEGKELPLAFLSKSLTAERLRWSVPEKEAFAIVFAFQKLEYILRDTYFVLRTDHKNLTYINQEGSQKVRRWKLAIQEYNFDIEHIPGEENIAADAFSRLCLRERHPAEFNLAEIEEPLSEDVKRTIRSVHNSVAGHNGVEKTLQKLADKKVQPWFKMRENVKQYIKHCPICQKLDQRTAVVNTSPFTLASREPMKSLSVDSIGPLPVDQYGNVHILVVIDDFTRFIELYAIKDVSALQAAKVLLNHLGRYGAPEKLRSDRGSQFVNETIQALLKLIGTDHELTLAESKEENAIVERANKEVMRHLRGIILEKKVVTEWSTFLPLIQRIMNASVHSSTGVSPAQLVFGNAVKLDRGIFLPHKKGYNAEGEQESTLAEWAEKMQATQAELIELARRHQVERDQHHIIQQEPANTTEFPINSYVLVKYRNRPPTKFHSAWRGPMRVVNFNKSHYTLQDIVTDKLRNFHVTQLKAFKYDQMDTDPVDIARAEQNEFLVENILEHRSDGSKRRTNYEFLVKWAGYENTDNTWEPWEAVRDNKQLIKYLYTHNLRQFLTKDQKEEAIEMITQKGANE